MGANGIGTLSRGRAFGNTKAAIIAFTVEAAGETEFMVYHAWDSAMKRRQMFISELMWTTEGPRVRVCRGDYTLLLCVRRGLRVKYETEVVRRRSCGCAGLFGGLLDGARGQW